MSNPLKFHGGKSYLAKWIIGLMPPRCKNPNKPADDDLGWVHYVEPYAGGLAVLFAQDPEGISEVVCDIDGDLTTFWDVLKSPAMFRSLKRRLAATPFSEVEFNRAMVKRERRGDGTPSGDPVENAAMFFVRCRQSMSGRMDGFTPLTRNRTRRGMNEAASAWMNAIDGLEQVHARLRRVAILAPCEATSVIAQQDGRRTLFYLDPPYLHSTRTAKKVYANEMTPEQHEHLLKVLSTIDGGFLLSGYRSDLYDWYAKSHGWVRHEKPIDNKSGKGNKKQQRVECIWTNF